MKILHYINTLFLLIIFCGNSFGQKSAYTLYYGGDIITMEGDTPAYAQSLVTHDGKIAFVGTLKEAEELYKNSKKINLGGKTMLPGFIDGHGHLFNSGISYWTANLFPPPDGGVQNYDDIINTLLVWQKTPDGQFFIRKFGFIAGNGYDDSQLKEQDHPHASDLDKVSTTTPVLVMHQSGHLCAVNHKFLALLNITDATPDPAGGHIRRDADGHANGVLEEAAAMGAFMLILKKFDDESSLKALSIGQYTYMKNGYTTAQEGGGNTVTDNSLAKGADAGVFKIDVVDYTTGDLGGAYTLSTSKYYTKDHTYKNHYRVGGMKLVLDGSPQGKTAWLTHPYHVPPIGQNAEYKGYAKHPADTVNYYVQLAFKNRWQLMAHTNGDAALDEYLSAIQKAMKDYGYEDSRTIIIHGQVMRKEQIQTIANLGLYASEYAAHTFYWGDWHLNSVLGSPRAEYISPCRDLIDKGINLTSHSDCPVIPPNSMRIIDATVNRVTRSGLILGPDQRITPYEGLLSQTRWAAKQYFEENTKGTLTPGKLADFVILDKNPLKVTPLDIHTITVLETIKEGNTVYKK